MASDIIKAMTSTNHNVTQPADLQLVKCPSCAAMMERTAERCANCKLTLRRLDLKFGAVPRHAAYLTDRTERVSMTDVHSMRDELRLFARKFPQCVLSVFIIDLPKSNPLNEYAFWLANRARFSGVEAHGNQNFDLLLVVDPANKKTALAAGYGLEEIISESDLADALRAAVPSFENEDFPAGLHQLIERLTESLKRAAEEMIRTAAKEIEI